MREYLTGLLVCPACHGRLSWAVSERSPLRGGDILEGSATCSSCNATYPVREGIGAFLTPDLYREDLWESVDSHLSSFLKSNPEVESKLLHSSPDSLGPADLFFRGMVLEERGDYAGAQEAYSRTNGMYTREYEEARRSQIDYVVDQVSKMEGPVIDLASGMGALVRPLAERVPGRPVVITDFSLRVLRNNKRRFQYLGVDSELDYVAFDARRMPFADCGVELFTTHVGLQNINHARQAIDEIGRVLRGKMLANSIFYPKDDRETTEIIKQVGMSHTYFKDLALQAFSDAGLTVSVENSIVARAVPTPKSQLLDAELDALPIKEMDLEWCTLVAQR